MEYLNLFRISAYILMVGFLGHTLGGMLATAKRGVGAGAAADEVLARMKSVGFEWRGGKCTWFGFWMGNGLGVSALLIPVIVGLYTLGGLTADQIETLLPMAWAITISLAALSGLGFKYFAPRVGIVFGLIAILTGIATVQATLKS
jgi:hypothetical protein